MATGLSLLMVTSEWPTAEHPEWVPFLVRQVDFLRRAGVDVDVFAFRGARRPERYLKAWVALRRRLAHGKYDLIHAQFGQSGLLALPKSLPLVVTFRGTELLGELTPDGRETLCSKLIRWICRDFVARKANAVIVVADHMRRWLPPTVSAHVVPSGLDFAQLPRLPVAEARIQLGLPLDERLVLFVGSSARVLQQRGVKRYPLAQKAVEILNQSLPTRLVVAVGVPHSQIPVYMSACDALVFASMREGSPNVIKEALACDLPVVSVSVGDVAERLEGVEGCELCPDDDPNTIAQCLERVLRRGKRIAGREAVQHLDESLLAQQMIRIYRSVLGNTKEGGNERHPSYRCHPLP